MLLIISLLAAEWAEINQEISDFNSTTVVIGAERLLEDFRPLIEGKRVGIITNHSAVVGSSFREDGGHLHLIDLIHEDPDITITALFGPEHGIRGHADAGEPVDDSTDELTGSPVYSLRRGG